MKTRKKNQLGLWVMVVSVFFLLAAPTLYAENIPAGQTKDIDYVVSGILWIDGTANFRTGASASYIYVQNGGTLNMYSGTVTGFINIALNSANMTVYGKEFSVDGGTIDTDGNWIPVNGMGTLSGKYEDESPIDLWILSDTPIKLVNIENEQNNELIIDIKPGSDENVINLNSKGVVPVAVITTDEFNASILVHDYSISFAGASPVHSSLCDVDEDGDMDMLFHFRTQSLELDENSTKATLTATIKSTVTKSSAAASGDIIEGTDKVSIKSSKKK